MDCTQTFLVKKLHKYIGLKYPMLYGVATYIYEVSNRWSCTLKLTKISNLNIHLSMELHIKGFLLEKYFE